MRLTAKKIEEILAAILGVDGLPLVREFLKRDNISEFDLANKTKKDIKVIRKMLYVLYNHNLVGFTRKKDKEKGWYIYYWTLLPENVRFSYFKTKREQLERLRSRLEEEVKELFFTCSHRCTRLNFDQALGFDFRCPECGELIAQDSSVEKVAELRKQVAVLVGELKEEPERKKTKKVTITKKVIVKKAKRKRH